MRLKEWMPLDVRRELMSHTLRRCLCMLALSSAAGCLGDVEKSRDTNSGNAAAQVTPLDPATIPQFVEPLSRPRIHVPVFFTDATTNNPIAHYAVTEKDIQQQILPRGFPRTTVYAYGGVTTAQAGTPTPGNTDSSATMTFSSPGPTFEAVRDRPIFVQYRNELRGSHIFPVDPTLHGVANPNMAPMPLPPFQEFPPGFAAFQSPIPIVVHLHGGYTPSTSDGFPRGWF